LAIVRQERDEVQHSEAVDLPDRDRLLAGSDDSTISTKRFWKSEPPICGVVADVAPGGAQTVNPALQEPSLLTPPSPPSDAVATSTDAIIASREKWKRIAILVVIV
jgi:hypothetical protein